MRTRDERRARLVEADVPVDPEPEDLQIDAPGAADRALVLPAFSLDCACAPIQAVDAA